MKEKDKESLLKAGKICSETKEYIKKIVKKDIPLLEIAEKIEAKINELGGKSAFPVNTSINEIAAHYTPSHDDKTLASGLLKVDFGVHINGWTADNAISFNLDFTSSENQKLIDSANKSLNVAIETVKKKKEKTTTKEIGTAIQNSIISQNLTPIINLSGHSIDHYDLHSGITIPNINDEKNIELEEGIFAIEPFVTLQNASGKVHDGKPSGIYQLRNAKNVRSPTAREVLAFIEKEYSTLPFCSRWLYKKFGPKTLIALRELESAGIIHQYAQLIESSKNKVAQAEHTILIEKDKVTVTTI